MSGDMKTILLLVGAAAMALSATGCSTGAAVNTPVVDVAAGASAGR